ncbi:hypothetical protein BWI17_13535 [Betaproteobacteria bacterium GR16-43]|nr:hypothetical protein BWI17_13535 [Betaproteobacteria bacterium GR16-43]
MASAAPTFPRTRIGRFEVLRVLGQGAQGTVHLAHDTHLDRQVALKTLRLEGADESTRERRGRAALAEARLASQLSHPNIVTLHDVLEDGGSPCLVFEYVSGKTLAEALDTGVPLETARAVVIALEVLRGLECAHAKGIIHRDLKPSNVLLTEAGVARVMDFGIARLQASAEPEAGLTGSPPYLAPEYMESRRAHPSNDLYALAVTLHEMLTGKPAFMGKERPALEPPSRSNPAVDERLDAFVMKALAKDPAERHGDAAKMIAALADYLDPAQAPASGGGTVDFLLRRMRHKSDFPALSSTVQEINRLLASEREPASMLCNTVLKDFALTNKLLRLVNAALYTQFGGSIGTVSRAVAVLGFEGVRSVALTLMLFEHLQNKPQASAMREEIASAYFSGVAAREFARNLGQGASPEESFVCAMFHRLGRLLALYYLNDEAQAIQRLMEARGIDEHRAAREVLGVTYDDLGIAVARQWNFPATIVESLQTVREAEVTHASYDVNPARIVAEVACAMADAAALTDETARIKRLSALHARFGRATGSTSKILADSLDEAQKQFSRDAPSLGLGGSRLARLPESTPPAIVPGDTPSRTLATAIDETRLDRDTTATVVEAHSKARAANRRALLAAGVQDITQTLAGDFVLNDVLRMIVETAYRAIGFKRVLFFTRDTKGTSLRCRLGFGADAADLVARGFSIPLEKSRDLFSAALGEAVDICIADIDAERIREHVPAWFRANLATRGLTLFPLHVKKSPIALIYADSDDAETLRFEPEELNLLKALRNQALLAIRHHG